ncbi:hypothetical protein FRX31_004045 [Thalictrum thalictroides]|uniref:Neprosin PEP catalytic domain-containing protein n=1 Tax=Thalictrum thalictroides TaxID=46969 RepID=A0A7J6XA88_THATH|nr:hypothetical protein FRX31_004045 [Thalictrum thalictroides]
MDLNPGYWPKELEPLLAEGANQIVWGGQPIVLLNGTNQEMGSGLFPDGNYYFGKSQFADSSWVKISPYTDPLRCEKLNF